MRVKELKEKLSAFDGDMEVLVRTRRTLFPDAGYVRHIIRLTGETDRRTGERKLFVETVKDKGLDERLIHHAVKDDPTNAHAATTAHVMMAGADGLLGHRIGRQPAEGEVSTTAFYDALYNAFEETASYRPKVLRNKIAKALGTPVHEIRDMLRFALYRGVIARRVDDGITVYVMASGTMPPMFGTDDTGDT